MTSLRRALWEFGLTRYALKEYAVSCYPLWKSYEIATLWRARKARRAGSLLHAATLVTGAVRRLEDAPYGQQLRHQYTTFCDLAAGRGAALGTAFNPLLHAYLESPDSRSDALLYLRHGPRNAVAMKFPKEDDRQDRQGNLLVLKASRMDNGEKGILYLQYTESIRPFAAMFDLERLGQEYRLVLEPSSWGYQNASFLLLCRSGLDVLVQSQDQIDFEIVNAIGGGLEPIRLGAGDWIDGSVFRPDDKVCKDFDIVMVASWLPIKRHIVLLDALRKAGLSHARVALVGYPWESYTKGRIEEMVRKCGLQHVSLFESITRQEVASVVSRSKVGVMLTRREGANRGIYECLFSDVPVILHRGNRGVNKDHINARTGYLASDEELPHVLAVALGDTSPRNPRAWALEHTGHLNAWRLLNERLRTQALSRGESWKVDIAQTVSTPGLAFLREEDRVRLSPEYERLESFLRES